MLFLSYSREDHDDAVRLEAELLQSNVRVYRDPPALVADAFWRDKVKEQLSATDILIVLWSKDARLSPWVDQEIRAFCGRVVVIVSDATPWPYTANDHQPWFVFDKRSALSTITSVSKCHEISGKTTAMAQEQVCEEQILRKRRELTRLARLELKQFSREAGRPTRITPLGDGTLAQNQWDGGILKRLKAGNGRIIYLATEPVTNLQYSAFVKVSGFPAPPTACIEEFSQPEQPVVGVTWFEASAYAAWAGGVLPTDPRLKELSGVSVGDAAAAVGGTTLKERGPLLVTHWGLSGPAILKLSAWGARTLHACGYRFTLRVNWAPQYNAETARAALEAARAANPKKQIATWCPLGLPLRLWEKLAVAAGLAPAVTWSGVGNPALRAFSAQVCEGEFAVNGKSMFKEEFVTCGGVRLAEVDFKTMESRLVPGLYFAGECLDVDGITGGFNFQNAWTTGYLAGMAMTA